MASKRKRCTRRGKRKITTNFYSRKRNSDGYHSWCKSCVSAEQAERRRKNPDKVRAYARQYYDCPEQKAKKQEYQKKNRQKLLCNERRYQERQKKYNAEIFYQRRRENAGRRYYKDPEATRDRSGNNNAKRRLRTKDGFIEKVCRRKVHEKDSGRCWICGRFVALDHMHLDHIVPLFAGGEHSYTNVATACAKCNLRRPKKQYQARS